MGMAAHCTPPAPPGSRVPHSPGQRRTEGGVAEGVAEGRGRRGTCGELGQRRARAEGRCGQHLFQVRYFRTNKTKPKELKAGPSPGGPHAPRPVSHARRGHTLLPRPCCCVRATGGEAQGRVLTSKHSFWKLPCAILGLLEKDLGEKGVCPTK